MPEIRYTFTPSGHAAVEKAFASIAKKAGEAAAATRAQERATKTGSRQAAQAGDKWAKAEQRLARRKLRARQQAAKAARKAADDEVKAQERKIAKIERMENRLHARMTRARERAAAQEIRAAERVARARRARGAERVGRGVTAGLRGVAAIGAVASGVGGAAARQSLQLQDLATKIAVQARGVGQSARDPGRLRAGFEEAAAAVPGAQAQGVAEAVSAIVTKTGDLKTALSLQNEIATTMVATGSQGEALGKTMADLMEKFDIKTVDGMRQAMSDLIFQGKKGSFELEDAARNFAKIGAAAERFGGMRGAGGLRTLGGLTQIARRATPSGEEAATAVESMFKQLVMKSGMIEKGAGVQVFRDKGKTQARDIQDILVETVAGFEGNLEKLQKVFDVRGIRAVSPLIAEFNRVKKAAPGSEAEKTAAGMEAMREMIAFATDAGGSWSEVQKDAAIRGQTSSNQLTAAWERVVKAVGSEFTPAIFGAMKSFAQLEKETGALSKIGTGLGKVFTALAEAGTLAADVLKALGILKPKDPAAQKHLEAGRQRREAEQAIDNLNLSNTTIGGMNAVIAGGGTKGEQLRAAQARGIDGREFLAYRRAARKREGAMNEIFTEDLQALGPGAAYQEFISKYASAGGGGKGAQREAQRMAARLQADPNAAMGRVTGEQQIANTPVIGTLMSPAIPNRNDAQVKAMQDYAEQLILQGKKVKDADLAAALKEVQEAAAIAADAMRNVGEGGSAVVGE